MNTEQERAEFEAWALEYNSDFTEWPNVLFVKNGSGKYAIIRVQDAWEAWQAALASPEVQALRDALRPLAEIDLTKELPNDLAWFVLRARAALAQERGTSDAQRNPD